MKLKAVVIALLALSFVPAIAQQRTTPTPEQKKQSAPAQEEVVSVTTNLVQIDVVVTNKEDKLVSDLRPEDFEVFEDKKRQQVTNFSYVATEGTAASRPPAATSPAGDKNAVPVAPARLRPEQAHRTVAIVVDDLGLSFESIGFVQKALRKFVEEQMQPGDQVAIIRTSGDAGALQQITTDKRQLYAAIENVRWNPAGRGGLGPSQQITDQKESLAANENSDDNPMRGIRKTQEVIDEMERERGDIYSVGTFTTLNFVIQGLKELPGRKSILFISEAFRLFSNQGRNVTLAQMLGRLADQANLASTVIYTLDASGLQDLNLNAADKVTSTGYLFDKRILLGGPGPGGGVSPGGKGSSPLLGTQRADLGAQAEMDSGAAFKKLDSLVRQREQQSFETQSVLSYLAQQTGGLFVRNRNDLSGGIQHLMEDQKGYYLIGYRPNQPPVDPSTGQRRFHDITVKVKRPGLHVRARTGYYGVTDEPGRPVQRKREAQLAAALISPFSSGGVGLRLTSLFGNEEGKGSFLRSLLHLEARDLTFSDEADGSHNAVIDMIAVNFGDNGRVIDQLSHTQTISLRGDAYQQALQNGLIFSFDFPVKQAGAYQLRVAVRDSASARVGSARQFVEVAEISKNYLTLSGIVVKGISQPAVKRVPANGAPAGPAPPAAPAAGGSGAVTDDPQADPAVRRLRQGMMLDYRYAIYNAQLDPATNHPQLTTQMRLFRDGKEVFTGRALPFEPGRQTDMKRLGAGGRLRLGSELIPGDYFLQVVVTDALAREKNRTATQWIDFEVVN
jgi:VWFA-related protein